MGTTEANTDGRRIGELATATGLTVRTLHHYDEIELLVPSARSAAGHRLYGDEDVARLYRICLLRRLGLPLAEITRALDDPAANARAAMVHHLAELDRRIEAEQRLRSRLAQLVSRTTTADGLPAHDLLTILEDMTMLDPNVQRRISMLVYEDIEASVDFLIRVFELGPATLTRDDEGVIHLAELQAGDGVVWIHPESPEFALFSPQRLGGSSGMHAVMVDDVDAHFRHSQAEGAIIEYEPVDQPYGYREYSARDREGGLWSFMKPLV
jgi:DNA-binding transcriptional MerR regulator/uncharacterized glyoxalase superfamily protein PhnB